MRPGQAFPPAVDDRDDRRRRLAVACRVLSSFGIDEDVAGQLTVRDPLEPEMFWTSPYGAHFATIRVSDLLRIDAGGALVEGDLPANSAAFGVASALHAARPEVVAVAHAHGVHGRAWSTLGRLLDPISQDACVFYEDHGLLATFNGPTPSEHDRELAVEALGVTKAMIMANHGLLTVAGSVDAAAWWLVALERCCQAQLLAEATGRPPLLVEADVARHTRNLVGTETAGWLRFQQHFERILCQQPDVLD